MPNQDGQGQNVPAQDLNQQNQVPAQQQQQDPNGQQGQQNQQAPVQQQVQQNGQQNQQQQYQNNDDGQNGNQPAGGEDYNFGTDIITDMQEQVNDIDAVLNNPEELKQFNSEDIVEMYNIKAELEAKINPYLEFKDNQKTSVAEQKLSFLPNEVKEKVMGFVSDFDNVSEVEGMSEFVSMIWNAAKGGNQQQQPNQQQQTGGNIKGTVSGGQVPQQQGNDIDPLKAMLTNDPAKRASVKEKMGDIFAQFVNGARHRR